MEGISENDDPSAMIMSGCRSNNISAVMQGFSEVGNASPSLLLAARNTAISRGNLDVVRYLIEQQLITPYDIAPSTMATTPSIELFELLVKYGFDINKPSSTRSLGRGPYLLQQVCHDEMLVRWCIENGARVDGMYRNPYYSPPLLESVAAFGTVPTFKYLLSKGAKLEGRSLHCAAERVGARSNEGPEMYQRRLAMLKYLVNEVGLDVNAVDSEEEMGNFWGSPIVYAAKSGFDCADAVSFLLEKCASPEKDPHFYKAMSWAKEGHSFAVIKVLEEWESKHGKAKA